jgi:hypothetical protein
MSKQALPADDPMRQQLVELTQRLSHLPEAPARPHDGDDDDDDDEEGDEEEGDGDAPPRRMDEWVELLLHACLAWEITK